MKAHRILGYLIIASAFAASAGAQAPSLNADANVLMLAPGERVKFSMLDVGSARSWADRRLVVRGKLTDVRTDSLVLEMGGTAGRMTVARSALADLSVSRGMERGWRAHPGRTVVSGLLLGSGVALMAYSVSSGSGSSTTRGAHNSATMLTGVSVGLSSYIFAKSAFAKVERWEAVR